MGLQRYSDVGLDFCIDSAVGAANAGLDLEMPKGRFMNLENLLPAIKAGTVTEETINLKVQHILQTLIAYGMLDKEQTRQQHRRG